MTTNKTNDRNQYSARYYKTLNQEINETLKVINSNPTDPAGYKHAAKLYSIQGQQHTALFILDKGMNAISSPLDQLILRPQKDIIHARLERRIDFLTQCPYEIVNNIIVQLDNQNPRAKYICIEVSRAWRQKILSLHYLWKDLSFDDGTLTTQNYPLQVLPHVDNLVERLNISGTFHIGIELLKNYTFSSLKTLELNFLLGIENQSQTARLLQLYLNPLAPTLTVLKLRIPQATSISLYRILTWFPKLTSLNLHVDTLNDLGFSINGVVPATISNLTRLDIRTAAFVPLVIMRPLLQRAHNLRKLGLQCFRYDVDALSLIGGNCPKLEEIRVQAKIESREYFAFHKKQQEIRIPDQYIASSSSNNLTGQVIPEGALRTVELVGVETTIPLAFRLEKSSDTLCAMVLRMSERSNDAPPVHWQSLSIYTMHALRYLHICDGSASFYQHLPAILRRCLALEALYLQNITPVLGFPCRLDDGVWDALAPVVVQLSKLTTLTLENMDICSPAFERFFDMIQQESQHIETSSPENSGIQNLQLLSCWGLGLSPLQNVAKIKTLQNLTIVCHPLTALEDFYVVRLLQFIRTGLPRLQYLDLRYVEVTDAVAKAILASWNKNLKLLTLGHGCLFFRRKEALRVILKKNPKIYKLINM
ncbi:hypothetical protein BDA99DRAFT_520605 [Phascolomyces articulosus]|uniref:F-box domain-containing protein n=1 Tax=Phascolomyces articulosus TaxID=60185 RepID=A0AAD5JSE1_9FUNG|nr:hypothetical protein BDA99DRAFT_520605 [Phascolomyces articulosus]